MEEFNMENKVKVGHPVLGIVLGLLGIVAAVSLTFISGVIGGGLALLLGVIAIVIGISGKKKGGKGIGAILVGIVAVLMAGLLTFTTVAALNGMRDEAKKQNPDSLVAKYMDKPYLGVIGVMLNLPENENDMEALMAELDELSKSVTAATGEAPATSAN